MSLRSRISRLVPAVVAGTVALGLAGTVEAPAASAATTASSLSSVRLMSALPVLRYGAKGAAVRTLQSRLGLRADGDFGPLTLRAVKAFQRKRGLGADGVVGPRTWGALGLAGAKAPAPRVTGRYANGQIPTSVLCRIAWAPHERLRCDANHRFAQLNNAYRARFGRNIQINDAYRSYSEQVAMKRKRGRFAATPGRSNHGLAVALDLGAGINRFGSAQHNWMRANAPRFGWIHPLWARQGGRLPEAWHWEFRG